MGIFRTYVALQMQYDYFAWQCNEKMHKCSWDKHAHSSRPLRRQDNPSGKSTFRFSVRVSAELPRSPRLGLAMPPPSRAHFPSRSWSIALVKLRKTTERQRRIQLAHHGLQPEIGHP